MPDTDRERPRTYVVTGTASGIGQATRRLLEQGGGRVVGVDVRDAEIIADLSTVSGRSAVVDGVRSLVGDAIDAVIACAGVGGPMFTPETIVRVNYFGAVATLSDLRPFLRRGRAPRAVVIASIALLADADQGLVQACLGGDEEAAVSEAGTTWGAAYAATKRAVARWVRQSAVTPEWAGAQIALNAVAPGVIDTPQTAFILGTPEGRAEAVKNLQQPFGGIGEPDYVGSLLVWLTSSENMFVTGQVIFVDGGYDAVTRGDDVW
jgi:NAD(P)-dependent dehydrogenase (short-subunit alcohol dehydrogenase family)